MTFGRKINLSGSPVIRTKFGIRGHVNGDNVQGIFGAIGPFWAKWGLGRVSRSAIFLCGNPRDLSANFATADFHHIWSRNVFRCRVERNPEIYFQKFSL